MLSEFYYYFILPLTATAGLLGAYYVWNPGKSKLMLANLTWKVSKVYVSWHGWGDRFTSYFDSIEAEEEADSDLSSDEEETVRQSLLLYDAEEKNHYVMQDYDKSITEIIGDISPSIMFLMTTINGENYYKRTEEPEKTDSEYLTFTDKPFIQVEYLEDGKCVLDIHEHLTGFYVNGNMILDKIFLEWYLYYYYNRELADNYTLQIFDKDILMFDLSSQDHILLEDNKYTIVKDVEETTKRPRAGALSENYEGAEAEE